MKLKPVLVHLELDSQATVSVYYVNPTHKDSSVVKMYMRWSLDKPLISIKNTVRVGDVTLI